MTEKGSLKQRLISCLTLSAQDKSFRFENDEGFSNAEKLLKIEEL